MRRKVTEGWVVPKRPSCLYCGTPLTGLQRSYCKPEHRPLHKALQRRVESQERRELHLCSEPYCLEVYTPNTRGVVNPRCPSCSKEHKRQAVLRAKEAYAKRKMARRPPKPEKPRPYRPFEKRTFCTRCHHLPSTRPIRLPSLAELSRLLGFSRKAVARVLRIGGYCYFRTSFSGGIAVNSVPLEAAAFAAEALLEGRFPDRVRPDEFRPRIRKRRVAFRCKERSCTDRHPGSRGLCKSHYRQLLARLHAKENACS